MNKQEKTLLAACRRLPEPARQSLLDYAEFLLTRHAKAPASIPPLPLAIPRPAEESVIAAVKRLSRTYPMLNKDTMLHETSGLVAQHLIQGREAREVIDELEAIFRRHFDDLQSGPDVTESANHD